jgi:hypothetical protein
MMGSMIDGNIDSMMGSMMGIMISSMMGRNDRHYNGQI